MTHADTNLLGTVHGGVIMKLVDDAAGAVAGRHSGGPAVTASMDEMVFLEPVRVGDLVHVKAQVNWTGRSSMEVGVRVLAERWNESTPAQQVGSAYLVFAAVDADGKPRTVPPVRPGDRPGPAPVPGGADPAHAPARAPPGDQGAAGGAGRRGPRGLRPTGPGCGRVRRSPVPPARHRALAGHGRPGRRVSAPNSPW